MNATRARATALQSKADLLGSLRLCVCFWLQPVRTLAGSTLWLRVHEPGASPLTMGFGATRNIRTLGGVFGLGFLINCVFCRRQKEER